MSAVVFKLGWYLNRNRKPSFSGFRSQKWGGFKAVSITCGFSEEKYTFCKSSEETLLKSSFSMFKIAETK